jgi:hypothetical protein
MTPKYIVEYTTQSGRTPVASHYSTDDPVACEEFVEMLLDRGAKIQTIKHSGQELEKRDFDRMIKTAAGMLASSRICTSLDIKPEEEHYRFGFTG